MKKLIALLVICFAFVGCTDNMPNGKVPNYEIVIIDSCQYLKFVSYGPNYILTHKGNCNNPIHKNNK